MVLSILKISPRKKQKTEDKKNKKMELENKMDEDYFFLA